MAGCQTARSPARNAFNMNPPADKQDVSRFFLSVSQQKLRNVIPVCITQPLRVFRLQSPLGAAAGYLPLAATASSGAVFGALIKSHKLCASAPMARADGALASS
jgi:hypothetical protein